VRALLVVAAFCALLIVGCGGGTDEAAGPPSTTGATESTPAPDASGRRPAPAIEGVSLDGEPISLADYRGRPVFVNVWSSW
jgi:cytochrome oxidase Cu insertion factor (SCO1/SenC/PrrC family)